jgi:Bacterial TSP3 repeat
VVSLPDRRRHLASEAFGFRCADEARPLQFEPAMTLRPYVGALLASLSALAPSMAQAAWVASLSVGGGDCITVPGTCSGIAPGSAVTVSCSASQGSSMYLATLTSLSVTASAGTLGVPAFINGNPASTAVTWTAPASGSATITCRGVDTASNSTTASVTAEVSAAAAGNPTITGFTRPTGPVITGAPIPLSVTATDPAGGTLTYAWTATGGTFDVTSGAAVTWTAPSTDGSVDVTVAVSNAAGSTTRVENFQVVISVFQGNLATQPSGPRRLAAAGGGDIAVADGEGKLYLFTRRGELRGAPAVDAPIISVAAGNGTVFAATRTGVILTIDAATGRVLRRLRLGTASGPVAMAWDAPHGLLWIAEQGVPGVRALLSNGTVAREIRQTPAGLPLGFATDVAVDGAGNVWIAQAYVDTGPMVHAFNAATGAWVRSIVNIGSGPGQVLRVGGIGFDLAGRLFVSDAFSGNVKVVAPDGTPLGTLGSFGGDPGQLRQPAGLAPMVNGDVLVANFDVGRLDRFGVGLPLPTCTVKGLLDSDCDGMPDAWELAHRLNPFDPSDAWLDPDHDGLTNLQEYAYGTDPWNADTDGDGIPDGAEVLAGTNPLDPRDGVASMMASGPAAEVRPGEIHLSATVMGPGACTLSWKQVGGPLVVLRAATSLTPSFIGRTAGVYTFEGWAQCGASSSAPSQVAVTILNVAPRAAADRMAVVAAGDRLELSAAASSDANGDALGFNWEVDQAPVGAAASIALRSAELGLGYHPFRAVVRDTAGLADAVEVPVMVVDNRLAAPTAIVDASVLTGEVGLPVQLSAAASVGPAIRWEQVSGPTVSLSDPAGAMPTFVPPVAGLYVFAAYAVDGLVWSAPARVEVYVADGGAALPRAAVASIAAAVPVNVAIVLDGSGSLAGAGGVITHGWKQVAGPAAALVDEDRPQATAVAFVPGWYQFELTVSEAGVTSLPVRIGFEARVGGAPIPVARASAPAGAIAGELVRLDGRASSGARHFHWTQVAGPWVALKASQQAPTFVPVAEGTYRFELEVDDGTVRSRPASVSVLVNGKGN